MLKQILEKYLTSLRRKVNQVKPTIFVFDRDDPTILNEVSDESKGYRSWGNNVFSFAIPVPNHRNGNPQISIEFYYKDEEIRRKIKAVVVFF